MKYSSEVQNMCPLAKGAYHGPAPIPQEGKWTQAKEIKDISGLTQVSAGVHLSRVPASSLSTLKRALFRKLSLRL